MIVEQNPFKQFQRALSDTLKSGHLIDSKLLVLGDFDTFHIKPQEAIVDSKPLFDHQQQAIDALRSLSKYETTFEAKPDPLRDQFIKTLNEVKLDPELSDLSNAASNFVKSRLGFDVPLFYFNYNQPNWKRILDYLFDRNYEPFSDKMHHYSLSPNWGVAFHLNLGRYLLASYRPMQHLTHRRRTFMSMVVRHIFTKD